MKRFYSLETAGDNADLYIFGAIVTQTGGGWYADGTDVSPSGIVEELKGLTAKNITVHINSYGGETAGGLAIYNTLKNKDIKVKTVVDGYACSAAAVIFMAGEERVMNEASIFMIHNAWTYAAGNAKELRKSADDLDVVSEVSANAFRAHMTISEEELVSLLDNETYIKPEQAVEWGFATALQSAAANGYLMSARRSIYNRVMAAPESGKNNPAVTEPPEAPLVIEPKEEVKTNFQKLIGA
ncbi:MAG: Clp protease ClpP [Clostridiales Family XIII bacterium]|jgi:ATP-dependent protease ClpP protease subunit|nr:Clp protease ClpP [Clostridiales Family XIII bacterium]